jgi:hypothetical protein
LPLLVRRTGDFAAGLPGLQLMDNAAPRPFLTGEPSTHQELEPIIMEMARDHRDSQIAYAILRLAEVIREHGKVK